MEQVVAEAGVTRGALYHHFASKRELLAAVYEQLEAELVAQVAAAEVQGASVAELLLGGASIFLDRLPGAGGPADRAARRAGGARVGALARDRRPLRARADREPAAAGVESGEIARQPVEPLAHALLGALDELALMVARADDPQVAREEAGRTLETLVRAFAARR